MKCLILAAGYATRLYPLTENFPKPLLDINGKSIIDWLIDDIEENKLVDEYIIVSNHKFYNNFMDWREEKKIKDRITILDDSSTTNENRLGAVRDIEYSINKLNLKDNLLIVAGDNLLNFSLKGFVEYFKKKNATSIMRYYCDNIDRLKKSANIRINEEEKVIEMIEKPEVPISNWCCPAFYVLKSTDLEKVTIALKSGCGYDAPGSLFCWLAKNGEVYAYDMPGKRYDIGTIETYEEVKKTYNQGVR